MLHVRITLGDISGNFLCPRLQMWSQVWVYKLLIFCKHFERGNLKIIFEKRISGVATSAHADYSLHHFSAPLAAGG